MLTEGFYKCTKDLVLNEGNPFMIKFMKDIVYECTKEGCIKYNFFIVHMDDEMEKHFEKESTPFLKKGNVYKCIKSVNNPSRGHDFIKGNTYICDADNKLVTENGGTCILAKIKDIGSVFELVYDTKHSNGFIKGGLYKCLQTTTIDDQYVYTNTHIYTCQEDGRLTVGRDTLAMNPFFNRFEYIGNFETNIYEG